MQPFEAARPIVQGRFVPWIATGPPCAHHVSTFENAEMPIARARYGPAGSLVDEPLVDVKASGRSGRRR